MNVRIALDTSVINWKSGQGLNSNIQADSEKRREYQAIETLQFDTILIPFYPSTTKGGGMEWRNYEGHLRKQWLG